MEHVYSQIRSWKGNLKIQPKFWRTPTHKPWPMEILCLTSLVGGEWRERGRTQQKMRENPKAKYSSPAARAMVGLIRLGERERQFEIWIESGVGEIQIWFVKLEGRRMSVRNPFSIFCPKNANTNLIHEICIIISLINQNTFGIV